ncbi:coiled-coil domain-containing protein 96 isoform X2 [Dendroctonus ponderosae]|uniref:coiled-coil domain-containing protein 96 isoform X2 n=1 Tax=Dendroctonus ponderosae TaxID=77166 RepID=UPI002034ED6D|nr:coiled-coil domain-containing protein 96 isoform X2 [Dendroctonus ponderosae]
MESQSQLPRKPKVILPDDESQLEENFDDLMGPSMQEANTELGLADRKEASKSLVQIVGDEEAQEGFFEEKTDKQPVFGEIAGMTEINNEYEDEKRPSISAQDKEVASEDAPMQTDSSITASKAEEDRSAATEPEQLEAQISKHSKEAEPEQLETHPSLLPEIIATQSVESDTRRKLEDEDKEDVRFSTTSHSNSAKTIRSSTSPSFEPGPSRRRRSIYYDLESRIESTEQENLTQFFSIDTVDDFVLADDHAESVEEESLPTIIEEEAPALDRDLYYARYMDCGTKLESNRVRNNVLQKIVIMYLKRRKVENVCKDSEAPLDQVLKYGQKLDAYQQLMQINETQRLTVAAQVEELRSKRATVDEELKRNFLAMQNRESAIGRGLIYAKTGNQIPDKLIERFLRRQSDQLQQVSTMRLKFIKLKGMVEEKLDAINKLDNLENNLHLADYEQLKSDNRSYADKIEERDEELARLRNKCQNTIQILAHMREKSAALEADMDDLKDDFYSADETARDYRENLADIKHAKDRYRLMARNLKEESGLLTKNDLLDDMERSKSEVGALEAELAKCQEDVKVKKTVVRKLRKTIEELTEEMNARKLERMKRGTVLRAEERRKSTSESTPSASKCRMVYKKRPTLYLPVIQQDVFRDLVKIRPTPSVLNRRK